MLNRVRTTSIVKLTGLFLVLFIVITSVYHGGGYNNHYYVLVSVASFLFGIFLSFSISNNQAKFNKVNELLKIDNANLHSLYNLSLEFGPDIQQECRKLIDEHLVDQIDFKLLDFKMTSRSFNELYKFWVKLAAKTPKQEAVFSHGLGIINSMSESHKELETIVQQKVTKYEWASLILLFGLICYFVVYLNDRTLSSILLSSTLVSTGFILLLVLRDISQLRWYEESWIWEPLHNLFLDLDLIPYYSEEALRRNKANLASSGKIRIAHYEDPYPDRTNKVVEVIENA